MTIEIVEKALDRCDIEDELIEEGKLPADRLTIYETFKPTMEEEDERCFIMTSKVLNKCKDLIVFNVETMNQDQINVSMKEYAKVTKILARLEFLRDLQCIPANPLFPTTLTTERDLDSNRVQSKVWRIKLDMISEEYGKADFNYQLFTAVLQDHLENERKKRQKKDQKDKQDSQNLGKPRSRMESPAVRCLVYLLLIAAVILAFGGLLRYLPQTSTGIDPLTLAGLKPSSN